MRIIRDDAYYRNEENTPAQAAMASQCVDPYEFSGELETIKGDLEKTRDMLAALIDLLVHKNELDADDMRTLLDYRFKVEP